MDKELSRGIAATAIHENLYDAESAALGNVLTVNEAARYLRVSPWTLRHWMSKHIIPYVKYNNGPVRLRRCDLDRFIARSLVKSRAGNQD